MTAILAPSQERTFVLHHRGLANARMAALALAIRAYEVDSGRRPERLDELVGNYIPAIPDDPFAEEGVRLSYLPNAKRPILYSFNEDCIDNGGDIHSSIHECVGPHAPDFGYLLDGGRNAEPAGSTGVNEIDNRAGLPTSATPTSQATSRPAPE